MQKRNRRSTKIDLQKYAATAASRQEPVFLAYKIDPKDGSRALVKVRETDFEQDKNLVRLGQRNESQKPVPNALGDSKNVRHRQRASRQVTRTIRKQRLGDTMKAVARDRKISKASDRALKDAKGELDILSPFLLALAEQSLREKGLWNDTPEEIPFAEAFPESRDEKFRGLSKKAYNEGTFLQDEDITVEDRMAGAPGTAGDLPGMSVCSLFELMRPPPASLEHQLARKLAEGAYFAEHEQDRWLYLACLLFSRGVTEPGHFIDALGGGLYRHNPEYYCLDYEFDLLFLPSLLERQLKKFFHGNRAIEDALGDNCRDPRASNIWARFRKAWKNLTSKQRHALEKLYSAEIPSTYEEAARDFGISVSSLQDRVRGAKQKIRAEFPEFKHLKPALRVATQSCDFKLNGLWRESNAKRIRPLKTYDLTTGMQIEITTKSTPRKKTLTPREIAEIKAHVYETAPIPKILDTEYFCGLRPGTTAREPEDENDD